MRVRTTAGIPWWSHTDKVGPIRRFARRFVSNLDPSIVALLLRNELHEWLLHRHARPVDDRRPRPTFPRWCGKPHLGRGVIQAPQPHSELRARHELIPASNVLYPKRSSGSIIDLIQLANQCTCFCSVRQVRQGGKFSEVQGLASQEQHRLQQTAAAGAWGRRVGHAAASRFGRPAVHHQGGRLAARGPGPPYRRETLRKARAGETIRRSRISCICPLCPKTTGKARPARFSGASGGRSLRIHPQVAGGATVVPVRSVLAG